MDTSISHCENWSWWSITFYLYDLFYLLRMSGRQRRRRVGMEGENGSNNEQTTEECNREKDKKVMFME